MNLAKLLMITLIVTGFSSVIIAQESNANVRVTTKTTALPTLEEQVQRLEGLLEGALQNPDMVADGTAAKYEQALLGKQALLRAEEEERAAWEAQLQQNNSIKQDD